MWRHCSVRRVDTHALGVCCDAHSRSDGVCRRDSDPDGVSRRDSDSIPDTRVNA